MRVEQDSITIQRNPLPFLYETWQSKDACVWTFTDPATGTAWTRTVVAGTGGGVYLLAAPNALETCRLQSKIYFQLSDLNTRYIRRKFVLEFEFKFDGIANLNVASIYLGLLDTANKYSYFTLDGSLIGASNRLEGLAGNPPVTTPSGWGDNVSVHNSVKMEITSSNIKYYLNHNIKATLPRAAAAMMVDAMIDMIFGATAGGAATIYMGPISAYYDDL
jgi:hypothetical protein